MYPYKLKLNLMRLEVLYSIASDVQSRAGEGKMQASDRALILLRQQAVAMCETGSRQVLQVSVRSAYWSGETTNGRTVFPIINSFIMQHHTANNTGQPKTMGSGSERRQSQFAIG